MKRTWLILLVIFVLCHGLFAATWSKWNNITVGSSAGNIAKWNNGTIGTTTGNIGAWNGLASPGGGHNYTPTFHAGGVSAPGSASSQSASVTVSAGDTIMVGIGMFNTTDTITSVKMDDGSTTSCTQLGTKVSLTSRAIAWYGCFNIPSGVTHVNTVYSGANYNAIMALPFTPGTAGTPALDVDDTAGNSNSGTSATTGAITTLNAHDLVFGYVFNDSGSGRFTTQVGSWTVGYEDHSYAEQAIVYQVVAATGTYTPAVNSSVSNSWYARGVSITLP